MVKPRVTMVNLKTKRTNKIKFIKKITIDLKYLIGNYNRLML